MECTLFKKQCVGNLETSFNIRLRKPRQDAKKIMPYWCAGTSKK